MTDIEIAVTVFTWTAIGAGVFVIIWIVGLMYLYGIFDRSKP